MATAAAAKDASPYEGGGGAGGKFLKNTFRRRQTTPYDRPSTARRSLAAATSGNSSGWISKVVNPASKLITASAHWIFGSVFQKRLAPPPPQPSSHLPISVAREEVVEKSYKTSFTANMPLENSSSLQQQNPKEVENLHNNSVSNGFTDLEQILKQKTFTRSEIERLTSLLHSRTLAIPESNAENKVDFALAAHDKEGIPAKSQMQENGDQSFKLHGITSSPMYSSRVVEEDVASPSEIAKAYMGSKSSKVASPLGLRSRTLNEMSPELGNVPMPFTPTSHIMSIVSNVGVRENGFMMMNSRSRGRSAIFNMARTPYSRVLPASSHKVSVRKSDSFGGISSMSPQYRLEGSGLSAPKKALKRGSYTLDNDIGSIGPIRRIRQKPNILPSKNMTLTTSETPSTSYAPIPSQSSEMAQKILQQLDKMTPSKDKSPELKLSVAMEESPSNNLKNVNFSRPLENVHDNGPPKALLLETQGFTSQKQNKVKENGPSEAVNGVKGAVVKKDSTPISEHTDSAINNPAAHHHPQKKWAFQMSAQEDYLDLEENGHTNHTVSNSFSESKENQNTSSTVISKSSFVEAEKVEKASVISDTKPLDIEHSKEITSVEKSSSVFAFPGASAATVTNNQAVPSPTSNSETNQIQLGETKAAPSIFNFNSNNVDKVSSLKFSSTPVGGDFKDMKPAPSSDPKVESSSSSVQVDTGKANITHNAPEYDKVDKSIQKAGNLFKNSETTLSSSPSTSSATLFSFGGSSSNNFAANNGSLSSPAPLFASTSTSTTTPTTTTTTSSGPSSLFTFGIGNTDAQVKKNNQETTTTTTFGSNLSSNPFGGTSSSTVTESTVGNNIFGSNASSISSLGSNPFGTTTSESLANVQSSVGTGSAPNLTQSTPVLFGSSTPTPSFGLTGATTAAASSSSLFGSSTASLFSSGATFGLTSSAPSSTANSTSSINGSSLFGSTTPIFGSTSNTTSPSPIFSFGGASVSAPSNASTGSMFSFSQSAANSSPSSSLFTPSQPVVSKTNPVFAFGSSPVSNDQMSMEDTMAEDDTVQASTPSIPNFGQTPILAPSPGFGFNSGTPSGENPFQFGNQQQNPPQTGAPLGAANPFQFGGQQNPSQAGFGANPFQFGNQPSPAVAAPTNQSPFQASGSFSLGTGGGGDKSNRRMVKVKRNVRKK